jgi:hypothetical protein
MVNGVRIMRYELWHVESANLMDDFEDQAEAFEAVRAYLTPDGEGVMVDVALVIYDDAGRELRSLQGDALAALVFGPSHKPVRQTA